jgi:predicted Na+-dependent transporter
MLVGGLLLAIAFPEIALFMKDWIPELVAVMLFVVALRIGPRQALGAARDLRATVIYVAILQVILPLAAAIAFGLFGLAGPMAAVLILMLAAPPISGTLNLTILCGSNPAPALRLLVAGTALIPLTVIPVFWVAPIVGGTLEVVYAAGRLMLLIVASASAAFLVRSFLLKDLTIDHRNAIDGASSVLMVVLVLGLMSAVGPALREDPGELALNLAAAFAANFGLQIAAALLLGRTPWRDMTVPFAISAGNRNIALFLTSLPAVVTDPLLLFIGCYQIPMYVTPVLLGRFYRGRGSADRGG